MGKKLIQNLENRLLRELDNQIHSWSTLKEIAGFADVELAIRVSMIVAEKARLKAEITFNNLIDEINRRLFDEEENDSIEKFVAKSNHFFTNTDEAPKHYIKPYGIKEAVSDLSRVQHPLKTGYLDIDRHLSIKSGTVTMAFGFNSKIVLSFQLNLLLNMLTVNPDRQFYFIGYKYTRYELLARILMILSGFTFHNIDICEGLLAYIREAGTGKRTIPEIDSAISCYEQVTARKDLQISKPLYTRKEFAMFMDEVAGQKKPGVVFIDDFAALQPMMKSQSIEQFQRDAVSFLRQLSAQYGVSVICGNTLQQKKFDMELNGIDKIDRARFLSKIGGGFTQYCQTILWVYPRTEHPDDPDNNNVTQLVCRCMQSASDDSEWAAEFAWNADTLKII